MAEHDTYSLPNSWEAVEIRDIGEVVTGNTPSKKDPANFGGLVPFVKPPELLDRVIEGSTDTLSVRGTEKARIAPANSVLVSCIGNLGKTGINREPVAFNQQINAILPNAGVHPKFVFYQAQSGLLRNQLEEFSSATTIAIINKGNFERLIFRLAPSAEQECIVSEIEELFSELDKGIETLEIAREQLKVYRQAVLKHAFEGKLTEQWREENTDKKECPEETLARIELDRESHKLRQLEKWEAKVEAWKAQGKTGKKPGKPKQVKCLKPFTDSELTTLPDMTPSGWSWVKLDKICAFGALSVKAGPFGSALKKESYVPSGYKVYGQEQVISGDPDYGDYFVDRAKYEELATCKVAPRDVLISLVGTVGKVLILPVDCAEGIINPRLVKISLNSDYYRPEFFSLFFESAFVRGIYKNLAKGTTMDVLNLGIIQSLPFPFCSLAEQDAVLEVVNSKLPLVDRRISDIDLELKKSEVLRQAILKRAFSGQLVAQDPNDEPASVLLERIRAEKAEHEKANGKKRKVVRRRGNKKRKDVA